MLYRFLYMHATTCALRASPSLPSLGTRPSKNFSRVWFRDYSLPILELKLLSVVVSSIMDLSSMAFSLGLLYAGGALFLLLFVLWLSVTVYLYLLHKRYAHIPSPKMPRYIAIILYCYWILLGVWMTCWYTAFVWCTPASTWAIFQ